MAFDFIPNIPAAPHSNTSYIAGAIDEPPIPQCTSKDAWKIATHAEYTTFVHDKRVTADDIRSEAGATALGDCRVGSWAELTDVSTEWLKEHRGHMPALDSRRGRKSTIKFGIEGIVAASAFLEVIPKALAYRGVRLSPSVDQANDEVARYARHSQGFITKWARITVNVDQELAQGLALKSRKAHRAHSVFADLHFNPEYFRVDEVGERVGVDPDVTLRSWAGTKLSTMALPPPEKLFGCPALDMIPAMYQEMTRVARENSLLGDTYVAQVSALRQAG